jgi:hypothetical protein
LLIFILLASLLLTACGGEPPADEYGGSDEPAAGEEAEAPADGEAPAEEAPAGDAVRSPADPNAPAWTILLYMDADDDVLEEDIVTDLNEIELVGSSENIQIVAQLDRYDGSYDGDGDWASTKRYYVSQDGDLESIASEELEDLGEVDMGDGASLVDFAVWGIQNFPAQKYALILSDHGMGWPGGWNDPAPNDGSQLFLVELVDALQQVQDQTGVTYELLGFDACLMSMLEVHTAMAPFARYAVASEETEPAVGWAYASWLSALSENPQMDGAAVSIAIVDSYIVDDQRILDDQSRINAFGESTAEQVTSELGRSITLSAVDLQALPELLAAVDSLTAALSGLDQAAVAKARTYAQSYESIFGKEYPSPYIDLGHFADLAAQHGGSPEAAEAAGQVSAALSRVVIAEKHGSDRAGSTGIAIHFPTSQLYANPETGAELYGLLTESFQRSSSWDEFLGFHFTGAEFTPTEDQSYIPPANAEFVAPGAAQIELLPVEISDSAVAADGTLLVNSQVQGDNIAYVYTFAGYVDEVTNAILVADLDFYFTDYTIEVGGSYYPDFSGGGPFDLNWEWSPTIYTVNDGSTTAFALFEPDDYGAPDESPVYAVYGSYQYANGSAPDDAVLYFADGEFLQAYAYTGENSNGALWEVLPTPGDVFTVVDTIMTEDENGVAMFSYQEGESFTFGESAPTWEAYSAPAGLYVVGFVAVDFEGNWYYAYAPVEVTP